MASAMSRSKASYVKRLCSHGGAQQHLGTRFDVLTVGHDFSQVPGHFTNGLKGNGI